MFNLFKKKYSFIVIGPGKIAQKHSEKFISMGHKIAGVYSPREIKNNYFKKYQIIDNLEDLKISISEKTAQRDALIENTDLPKKDIDAEIKSIDMGVKQDILAKDLQKVQSKINSMGAINLAAIDELEDQQERKQYLDSQYNDLTESVKTLDNAIKKIDSETKSKFKEIFDSINSNLNTFFNQLFGGGKAYLELTDNDLLNTGVTIMARPPGKLVKNINYIENLS